jgi:HK97 family phage portal protein
VREILAETVDSAAESQKYLNTLYKSGLSASMALQYTGEIDKAKRIALQNEYNSMLSGAKNAGKVVAVPLGFQLQPIKMSLADAQFIDLRKYTALQIAAAFGIKPNQLNDYEKSSYSNSEMQQLSFLVDTMLYRLAQYEQEINYKVLSKKEVLAGFFFKFNEKAILRTDTKTQMDAIRTGVNNALYTPNEGRELLDRPAIDGGDVLMCNGNYIPVTDVGKQWQKGGNGANGGD